MTTTCTTMYVAAVHNGQELKNSPSIKNIYPLNGLLLGKEKEQTTDAYNTGESQNQKAFPQKE